MKPTLLFAFLSLLCTNLWAQDLILEIRNGRLYPIGHNHARFSLEGFDGLDLVITCDNGTVSRDSSYLLIIPDKVGQVNLMFSKVENKDTVLLTEKRIRVYPIPLPQASVFNKVSGVLSVEVLKKAKGIESIYVDWEITGCGVETSITRFKIIAMRDSELVGSVEVSGSRFTDEAQAVFDKVESGDVVYIVDVFALDGLKKEVEVNSLRFEIDK